MATPQPDRRARLRDWTRQEIKAAALGQLAESGPEGLSLNAIARELGMTGPALYRYVASRDELIADLVVDAWNDLSDALERAAEEHAGAGAAERLRAMALAYRAWATAQPHRYRLAAGTRLGSGELAPERVIPASERGMSVILDAIADLPAAKRPAPKPPPALAAQLGSWNDRTVGKRVAASVLLGGVVFWTRLHGVVSLELEGHLASMGLDPELVYAGEVDQLVGGTAS